jgi:hypothetical protein
MSASACSTSLSVSGFALPIAARPLRDVAELLCLPELAAGDIDRVVLRARPVRRAEPERHSPRLWLRHRTQLAPLSRQVALFTPPVARHAPGLVYRQRCGHEQQQQAGGGVEQGGWAPEDAEVGIR